MPKRKKVSEPKEVKLGRPALSPDARVDQIISMSYDLIEERIRDKTASNDLLKEMAKMGNAKTRLEIIKLQHETELLRAKTEAIESTTTSEKMIDEAMKAFQKYSGNVQAEESSE